MLGIRLTEDGEELPPYQEGECGIPQTVLAMSKSFVGSGITFLPGAFIQGGWLFSSVVLIVIGALNALCIWLLLRCSERTGLSGFGDIADRAAGKAAKQAVHVSLVVSQFGTNIAYFIFINQMATALGANAWVSEQTLVMLLVIVLIPLCYIRSIHRMEYAILGADVLIVFGLGVAIWYSSQHMVANGPGEGLLPFRPATCGLFMGTAVFTFEGIPYMLPIRSSMQDPSRFWPLFMKVFPCIVLFFASFGLIGYASYGTQVESIILLNLPAGVPLVVGVQGAYMIALILSSPLVFLPAARITELWVFGVVKEKGSKRWAKNAMRTVEVCIFGVIALVGGKYFEKFLAITGAVCCAPVAFIYPSFFHLKLCAKISGEKILDYIMIIIGVVAMLFVLYETL